MEKEKKNAPSKLGSEEDDTVREDSAGAFLPTAVRSAFAQKGVLKWGSEATEVGRRGKPAPSGDSAVLGKKVQAPSGARWPQRRVRCSDGNERRAKHWGGRRWVGTTAVGHFQVSAAVRSLERVLGSALDGGVRGLLWLLV